VLTDLSLISNLDYVVSGRSHEYDDITTLKKMLLSVARLGSYNLNVVSATVFILWTSELTR